MLKQIIDLDNILIGSDPEFFLERAGVIFPSTDIIIGEKNSPIKYGDVSIFKDNVLVEGNIKPAKSQAEFVSTMKSLKKIISEVSGGYNVISKDSHKFSVEDLMSDNAREFGCNPYNKAWKNQVVAAENLAKSQMRSAGFHIHIGYNRLNKSIRKNQLDMAIAKAYDFFCITPSRMHSNDEFRNKNYGEYGAYRNKPYGIEVRSLGGFFSKDEYLDWVYEQTIKTIEFTSNLNNLRKLQLLTSPKFTSAEYKFLNINLTKQLI